MHRLFRRTSHNHDGENPILSPAYYSENVFSLQKRDTSNHCSTALVWFMFRWLWFTSKMTIVYITKKSWPLRSVVQAIADPHSLLYITHALHWALPVAFHYIWLTLRLLVYIQARCMELQICARWDTGQRVSTWADDDDVGYVARCWDDKLLPKQVLFTLQFTPETKPHENYTKLRCILCVCLHIHVVSTAFPVITRTWRRHTV